MYQRINHQKWGGLLLFYPHEIVSYRSNFCQTFGRMTEVVFLDAFHAWGSNRPGEALCLEYRTWVRIWNYIVLICYRNSKYSEFWSLTEKNLAQIRSFWKLSWEKMHFSLLPLAILAATRHLSLSYPFLKHMLPKVPLPDLSPTYSTSVGALWWSAPGKV